MGLPPVPSAVQQVADKHDFGKIDWIQPTVVKNGFNSARGTYFFEYGMVVATGRLRLSVKPYPYKEIKDLKWDLYVNAWLHAEDGRPRFQQVRVWHIVLPTGTHTVEVFENVKAGVDSYPTDASRAEDRVWESIIWWSRGDVSQKLEDNQQPIKLCDRLVAHHDHVTIDDTNYKWEQITNVYSRVSEKNFSPKRSQQTVEVIIDVKIPGKPISPISMALEAYIGPAPEPSPTYESYKFERDEFDLPLFHHLVRGMRLRNKY